MAVLMYNVFRAEAKIERRTSSPVSSRLIDDHRFRGVTFTASHAVERARAISPTVDR